MIRHYDSCESRLLSRISDRIIHGPNKYEEPEKQLHILNLSEHDLNVSLVKDGVIINEWLIYPFVIGHCIRPKPDEYIILVNDDKRSKIKSNQFKKKSNVYIGSIDLANLELPAANKLWINEVLTKSDTIRLIGDGCIIEHREESKWSFSYVIFSIFFLLTISLIVIIISFYLIKNINDHIE